MPIREHNLRIEQWIQEEKLRAALDKLQKAIQISQEKCEAPHHVLGVVSKA